MKEMIAVNARPADLPGGSKATDPIDTAEKALYKRACGYTSVRKRVVKNPDGTTHIEVIEEEIPPDVTAIKFLLKNRKPRDWLEG